MTSFLASGIFTRATCLFVAAFALLSLTRAAEIPPSRHTQVRIEGDRFFINDHPTYAGRVWQGHPVEGLLFNTRMVQGIYDDLNPETVGRWAYPDTGKWDAERNNREFVAAMATWKSYGVLAFTLCLQGGSPQGYSKEQPWINSAFAPDGSLRPDYMERLTRILDEADRLGMVVILGYFYFGQDERVTDEAGVLKAVDSATHWVLDHHYGNVVIEIANECNVKAYDHAILRPARVSELITRVRAISSEGRRLLVGTSYTGGTVPGDNVIAASDFVLLHGNGKNDPSRIHKMVQATRASKAWHIMPIVVNEDDHFDFDQPNNHLLAAFEENASWGYFDPGESNYQDGYQCPPVNWGINTARKQAFFNRVAEITGTTVPVPVASPAPVAAPKKIASLPQWRMVEAKSEIHPREECAFIEVDGRFYLLGGRGINPVDVFDPRSRTWSDGPPAPMEVHHFQPVVWDHRIYIACAMRGPYPREQGIDHILIYDPAKNLWSRGPEIPPGRVRGSAGAVVYEGKLYLICGIQNGHTDGWVPWCDSYDFKTEKWTVLPDAPRARDHFEAAVVDGKIYAAGGRRSSAVTHQVFDLTIPEVDVFDLVTQTWSTLPPASNLPLPRAGTATRAVGSELIVFGGESMMQKPAHAEIQALNTKTGTWRDLPPYLQGRHGTSVVSFNRTFYVASGAGERGGSPLLTSMEMLKFSDAGLP